MADLIIKQGDQYYLPLTIKDKFTHETVDISELALVEVYLGSTRHLWPGDMPLSEEGELLVPVTQAETLAIVSGGTPMLDLRAKYPSGDVVGLERKVRIDIAGATSKEVL